MHVGYKTDAYYGGAICTRGGPLDVWGQKGGEGGMSARKIDSEEWLESAPAGGAPFSTAEDCELAQTGQWKITIYFRSARKRRMVPSGTPPAEAWMLRLDPSANVDGKGEG